MTVTWEVTSLLMTWPSARHFKWRHISKFLKNFFCFIFAFWAILHHLALKNFFVNFHKWRHFKWRHFSMTWPSASHFSSDRHLNDVTVTSSKWRADVQSQYLFILLWETKSYHLLMKVILTFKHKLVCNPSSLSENHIAIWKLRKIHFLCKNTHRKFY